MLILSDDPCEVWHYQDSDVDLIRRSINEFDWDRAFANKHVDGKVFIFHKTVLNVLSNFIPHEVILCDDMEKLNHYSMENSELTMLIAKTKIIFNYAII